jgi:hypothetical protein
MLCCINVRTYISWRGFFRYPHHHHPKTGATFAILGEGSEGRVEGRKGWRKEGLKKGRVEGK